MCSVVLHRFTRKRNSRAGARACASCVNKQITNKCSKSWRVKKYSHCRQAGKARCDKLQENRILSGSTTTPTPKVILGQKQKTGILNLPDSTRGIHVVHGLVTGQAYTHTHARSKQVSKPIITRSFSWHVPTLILQDDRLVTLWSQQWRSQKFSMEGVQSLPSPSPHSQWCRLMTM